MRQRGFTLIEVLVAVVVFSVLSVLAWRGLEALTRSKSFLQHFLNNSYSIKKAVSVIDTDLSHILSNKVSRTAVIKTFSNGFLLLRNKNTHNLLKGKQYQWVQYRYDEAHKTLYRYAKATKNKLFLYHRADTPNMIDSGAVAQKVLSPIDGFMLESYIKGMGWKTVYKSSEGLGTSSMELQGAPLFEGFRVTFSKKKLRYTRVISNRK